MLLAACLPCLAERQVAGAIGPDVAGAAESSRVPAGVSKATAVDNLDAPILEKLAAEWQPVALGSVAASGERARPSVTDAKKVRV